MVKQYCNVCEKKLKTILPMPCKCNNFFCYLHKHDHNCKYDYLKRNKERLKKENPKVIPEKI